MAPPPRPPQSAPEATGGAPGTFADLKDLRHALDPVLILAVTDRQGRILEVNEAFCAISGYSESELLGQDHRILNSHHHPKAFFRDMWATISHGGTWRGEIRNLAKDGRPYWVDTIIVPHAGADGRPERYLALRMDITHRKTAEGALASSGKLLKDLVHGPPKPAEELLQRLVEQIGKALEVRGTVLIGKRPGARGSFQILAGQAGDRRLLPQALPPGDSPFAAVLCADGPVHLPDLHGDDLPGLDLPPKLAVSFLGVPVRTNTGVVMGGLAILDTRPLARQEALTTALEVFAAWAGAELEWTRSNEFLRRSEARLDLALGELKAGMWEWDLGTREFLARQGLVELMGWRPEAIPTTWEAWLADLHPEDGPRLARLAEAHLRGPSRLFQARVRAPRAGGGWIPLSCRGHVVQRDDQGRARSVLGLVTDISELWAREEALHESQKMESLGLLAGSIAHDFNNLLLVMRGHTDLAQELLRVGQDPQEALTKLSVAVDRSTELVRQLLDYSGRSLHSFEPVDLSDLVAEMTGLLRVSVPKRILLELGGERGLPRILGDPSKLRQVVLNLITNASEAIGEAEGRIRLSLSTRLWESADLEGPFPGQDLLPGPYVTLEVQDTGCGMSEAQLRRIFEPFYTSKKTGRGLGLSCIQGIIRAHGGALEVQSTPGAGSTFRTHLPAQAGA